MKIGSIWIKFKDLGEIFRLLKRLENLLAEPFARLTYTEAVQHGVEECLSRPLRS